jgi:hypothetical protein
MKYALTLALLATMHNMGQTKVTGDAKTAGPCSPAITGSHNRVITNCFGNGGEKVEAPAFHEKNGPVVFSLGGMTLNQAYPPLTMEPFHPFMFNDYAPVTLRMKDDTLLFSLKLWSPTGQGPIEVENNEFKVNISGCDWNYTANALEVVDENGIPIFQMIRQAPHKIVVYGIFASPIGLLLANETRFAIWKVGPIPQEFILRPLFKYPAWKYPGKYADGSN